MTRSPRGPAHFNLGIERQHNRAVVAGRIGLGQAAADGAAVAHLRVADLARRFAENRQLIADQAAIPRSARGASSRRCESDPLLRGYNSDRRSDGCRSDIWAGRRVASSSAPNSGRRREVWRHHHIGARIRWLRRFLLARDIQKIAGYMFFVTSCYIRSASGPTCWREYRRKLFSRTRSRRPGRASPVL